MPLLREMLGYAKSLVMLKEQTEKNTADIKEIREELKRVSEALQHLTFEIRFDRQAQADNQEKLLIRLENQLLRFERRLPPPPPNPPIKQEP